MNNIERCFNAVSKEVERADNMFFPLWEIDDERLDILREYCEAIDGFIPEFDGEFLDVNVNDDMGIEIKAAFQLISVGRMPHRFYDTANRAVSLRFSADNDCRVVVEFEFPSLWEKSELWGTV